MKSCCDYVQTLDGIEVQCVSHFNVKSNLWNNDNHDKINRVDDTCYFIFWPIISYLKVIHLYEKYHYFALFNIHVISTVILHET